MLEESRHSLVRKTFRIVTQVIFTLILTTLLTRCAMTLWPIPWALRNDWGMGAYLWLQKLFDMNGCEAGEDMLILLTLSVTLIVSTLTCLALTRTLRKLRGAPVDPNVG